ncbi:MAG TPA: acyl carrier protein [Azonexus sp.]|nr:acyl carrier protein [Azonexus sp.]
MKITVPPALSGQRVEKRRHACCCQDNTSVTGNGAGAGDGMGVNSGGNLGKQWTILPQGCGKRCFSAKIHGLMNSLTVIREFLDGRLGVPPEQVVPEATLAALGVDSLMMLELVFEFEDRFGIALAKDLKSPKTVGDMVALMERLRSEKS